ncbi:hypothetical protein BFW88_19020 [Pseudomonas fluorescens]|nr:hypothetical protein BFW88_19020 [Pseudomonas fluorescens]OPB07047.1 hypothetical protein BFW92_18970 [Pseudomonas fluorescens]OPB18363.1 hypothetical protein BFW93_18995 [Pseudomonas fluorescens]
MISRQSDRVYYLLYQWLDGPSIELGRRLSDDWITVAMRQHRRMPVMDTVQLQMQTQQLGRIVAGIQWSTGLSLSRPPTVYFIKVGL